MGLTEGEVEGWERLAEEGDIPAMRYLGLLFEKSDPARSQMWLRRAADTGDAKSMFRLAYNLHNANPAESEGWYRRAAQAQRRWLEIAAGKGHSASRVALAEGVHPANMRRLMRSARAGGARVNLFERIEMPAHVIWVHWDFDAPVASMEWDLAILADPGDAVGEYVALFSGAISGSRCYLGLQTDVAQPELGRGIGKGLIFSTWWSFDASDTRLADHGFRELGTHEGKFVGVRKPYDWTVGHYRVTLSRAEPDHVGERILDWFDLHIQPITRTGDGRGEPAGAKVWAGGIRFPRKTPDEPATIDPGSLAFWEVYSRANTWVDVRAGPLR